MGIEIIAKHVSPNIEKIGSVAEVDTKESSKALNLAGLVFLSENLESARRKKIDHAT